MDFSKILKRFHISKYEIVLFVMLLFALALRLWLFALDWPLTNSDEGNMGILAFNIAFKGEHPIFYYGQSYMGPAEGYLAAILFHLFGSSLFVLRVSLLPFFVLFFICMYSLTRILHTKKYALFSMLFFAFSGSTVLSWQLKAIGGYPEIGFYATAICLIVVWLALSSPSETPRHFDVFRIIIYGVLGLIIGIAMWVDLLILPFVCLGFLFLLLFCRREVFSFPGLSLLLGLCVGLLPLIIYNLHASYDQNSIVELLALQRGVSGPPRPFLAHVVGAVGMGLPAILSYSPACGQETFPLFGKTDLACGLVESAWGVGYLILCAVVVGMSLSVVWKTWKNRAGSSLLAPEWTFEQRQVLIRACAHLMIIVCSLGTLLLYLLSATSANDPGPTNRYLMSIVISIPTVLWPLWNGIRPWSVSANWRKITGQVIRFSLLTLVVVMFVYGTCLIFIDQAPHAQQTYHDQIDVVDHLEALKENYVYAEYWTCADLIFLSNEKVICSVLDQNLHSGQNRYPPYQTMVAAAPHPTYIFLANSAQSQAFEQAIAQKKFKTTYQISHLHGYVIYSPQTTH